MKNRQVRVGVGVIIKKNGKVLIGKRKGEHGGGYWAFPGGHLEFGEKIEKCVIRETTEETSLKIKNINFGAVTNDIFSKEKHYITIFMVCDWKSGTPKIMEPDRNEKWEWISWNKLPKPLFLTIDNLLKQKFNPFEY